MTATLRAARAADVEPLLDLIRELYLEDGTTPFDAHHHRRAVAELVAHPDLGHILVFEEATNLVGYAVVTWGFSLEYRGRDAFLDELFIASSHRGQGLARQALTAVEEACRARGVKSLHLEVERANETAQGLYRRWGFIDHDRYLLTKSIVNEAKRDRG